MGNRNQQQERSVPETPEELVSLAQEYFSHEFPNSDSNCPSPSELARLIKSGELPDDALREHLLVCSRCFLTYTEGLQRSHDTQPAVGSLRLRITELLHKPWVRVLVASFPVLLLIVLAVFYFGSKNPQDKVTSINPPVEVVNANANVVTTTPPPPAQIDHSTKTEKATHVARIDLRNYSPQRGSETGEEPPPVKTERKATTFTITLPEDSPAGTYSVSIVDAFGKVTMIRDSHTADGKKLTVTMNLDNLRNQMYRLCVSRSSEPPNCYPIVIISRGKLPH
jgi:hypothetical protein